MTIQPDPAQPTRRRLAHPTWCVRQDCAESGEHVSRWHSVDPDRPRQLVEVDLRLTQAIILPAPVWVEVALRVGRERSVYDLTGRQTAALKHVLAGLLADIR